MCDQACTCAYVKVPMLRAYVKVWPSRFQVHFRPQFKTSETHGLASVARVSPEISRFSEPEVKPISAACFVTRITSVTRFICRRGMTHLQVGRDLFTGAT